MSERSYHGGTSHSWLTGFENKKLKEQLLQTYFFSRALFLMGASARNDTNVSIRCRPFSLLTRKSRPNADAATSLKKQKRGDKKRMIGTNYSVLFFKIIFVLIFLKVFFNVIARTC